MAERRAPNKYYPPEWQPELGSINHFAREFSKGRLPPSALLRSGIGMADVQGSIVDTEPTFAKLRRIRFELPLPIWCGGCGRHIARNVRFNADKRQIGWYHTTPVLEFVFKCPSCPQEIVIKSDPQNTTYTVQSGATAKVEEMDAELEEIKQEEGPFAQLERAIDREKKAAEAKPELEALEKANAVWQSDFAASQILRSRFRERKKREARMPKDPVGEALKQYGIISSPSKRRSRSIPESNRKQKPFNWD